MQWCSLVQAMLWLETKKQNKNKTSFHRNKGTLSFHQGTPKDDVSSILRKNWKTMVGDDIRLLKAFPEPPMVCFTRGKNLREEICQTKLPPYQVGQTCGGWRQEVWKK